MTREKASNIWKIIKAYGEGKTIQFFGASGEWFDIGEGFELPIEEELRIKPEKSPCGRCIDSGKEIDCGKCTRDDVPTENYTIEQNCGENRVEGGVLSISGSVSEKHYKPFEDTAELMVHYSKHFNIDFPPFYEPIIWVKRKDNDSRFLITGYEELGVFLEDCWQDLNDLHEQYVFLDGSCIGKEE